MNVLNRIAAIPTIYNGVHYRSRLEARWAAFFDLLGWQYQYEPFDLGEWSPDFLLTGHGARGCHCSRNVLVEVKPITGFDSEVALKMWHAAREKGRDESLLLLGVAPLWEREEWQRNLPEGLHLGWDILSPQDNAVYDGCEPDCAMFVVWADAFGVIADMSLTMGMHGELTGFREISSFFYNRSTPEEGLSEMGRANLLADAFTRKFQGDHLKETWAEACNAVQWTPDGGAK